MPLLDEHGQSQGEVPAFVTPETLERWLVCALIAERITEQPTGHPEHSMFATWLFDSELDTGEVNVEEFGPTQKAQLEESRIWRPEFHLRGRIGRFINMPGKPKAVLQPPPKSPGGQSYSWQDIVKAGLDRPPSKGQKAREILGDAKDTAEIHTADAPSSPGEMRRVPYTQERKKLHDRIVKHFKKGKTQPGTRPHALFTAGGPASGKSTVLEHNPGLKPPEEHTVHINSDDIMELMDEYQALRASGDHYAAVAVHREAGDIATRLLFEAMEEGYNVIIDGVGNDVPGVFSHKLERVRDRGYSVDVLYVNAPTDSAIVNAIERAEETGRYVPVPIIREKHALVSLNFVNEVVELGWLNSLNVIDEGEYIATWERGRMRRKGRLKILNREKFVAFANKRKESSLGE